MRRQDTQQDRDEWKIPLPIHSHLHKRMGRGVEAAVAANAASVLWVRPGHQDPQPTTGRPTLCVAAPASNFSDQLLLCGSKSAPSQAPTNMWLPPSGSSPTLCFELAEQPEARSLLGEAPLVSVINARREFLFAALGSVFPKAPAPTSPRASTSPKAAAPKQKPQPQRKQERRPRAAAALQRHVGGVAAPSELRDVVLAPGAAAREQRGSLVMRVGSALQPQGDSGNDTTLGERVINILTSVPFSLVGLHMLRCAVYTCRGCIPRRQARGASLKSCCSAMCALAPAAGCSRRHNNAGRKCQPAT